ncbi:MAG: hypothetical protein N2053_09425, partial [Chitinispirillaceae bacterium]|nr:hypothetical protein [Chitinispirillaceae bacterium]
MKSISPFLVVLWTLLFTSGIILGLIGSLTALPALPFWIVGIIIWLGDAIWITIALLKYRKRKRLVKPVAPASQFSSKIMKETEEAVKKYTNAVMRKGLLKKSALYERPWFLLCGTSKSGKSSLLKGSGLYFPLQYPTEKDGLIVEGSN